MRKICYRNSITVVISCTFAFAIFYNPLQSRELPNVNFFLYADSIIMLIYLCIYIHRWICIWKWFKRSIHVGQTMSTSKCNCSFINKDEYFVFVSQRQRIYFNRVTKESSQLLFHDRRYKKGGLIRMLL